MPPGLCVRNIRRDIRCRSFRIPVSRRVCVMGILNVTPDSFSDGNKFFSTKRAIARAREMAMAGADIIDVGGESTRPGAADLSACEESGRVVPVIRHIAKRLKIPISVDTRKSEVAEEAIAAGASIINDVSGLKYDSRVADVAARTGAGIILMHMKGTPRDMQDRPFYKDVVGEIIKALKDSIRIAGRAGVAEDRMIVDPGIGFGKSLDHNLAIINRLKEFSILNKPICVGISRKSFIGKMLDIKDPGSRLIGTVAANAVAVTNGASILRVHDVKEARETAIIAGSILKRKEDLAW